MNLLFRFVHADLLGRLSKNEMIRGNTDKAEGQIITAFGICEEIYYSRIFGPLKPAHGAFSAYVSFPE